MSVALYALAELLKWSGTSVLPRVSRRSERRGLLSSSCPMKNVEPRGIAPRSALCHSAVLLLNDDPEMERAPGLAPGKSGFASRRLDDFGIAREVEIGGPGWICTINLPSQSRALY